MFGERLGFGVFGVVEDATFDEGFVDGGLLLFRMLSVELMGEEAVEFVFESVVGVGTDVVASLDGLRGVVEIEFDCRFPVDGPALWVCEQEVDFALGSPIGLKLDVAPDLIGVGGGFQPELDQGFEVVSYPVVESGADEGLKSVLSECLRCALGH